uniref:Uncharacterized protein n=1 Tax=Chenopodium quinoa TaxID=63459 RepID=A0A803LV25_CHEQI
MVKKKSKKKSSDDAGGSIGGYRYKVSSKGKAITPKESAKGNLVPAKVKTIPKKAKTVPEESAKGNLVPTRVKTIPLRARCRPYTLGNLVKNFSDKQKQVVVEVGFGGLLHLKLKTLCRKMLPWLVENFNGGSCMFTVGSGKDFVVTKNDVCGEFCLPMGDIHVPELKKNVEVPSVDNYILQEFVDGGVAFKRFFVVHAMSSFLIPTPNRKVSLKLLKAVEEVDEIKTFDWYTKVKSRINLEVNAGGFGHGPLDTSTYPLSHSSINQTAVKQPVTLGSDQGGLNVGGACSSGTIDRFVQFELPDGVMTDDEIKQISTNVVHESFLLLKRNMDVFSSVQSKGFKTLSDLVTNVRSERTTSLSYGIIEECMKMKSSAHEFFQFDIPNATNHVEANREEDVPDLVNNKDVPDLGNNPDIPKLGNNQGVPQPIRSNKTLCLLDFGPVGQKVPFVTMFMRGNARIFDSLPQLHLEVLDCSLLKDESMNRNENLVTFGMNFLVPREDMESISSPLMIRWCIVDFYALYLNEVACFESSSPRRFFFGVRQSFALLYVYELEKGENSGPVKDLHDL